MVPVLVLLSSLVGCFLVLSCAFFLGFTLYVHYVHVKYSHIPGPKRKSFFTGNLPDLIEAIADKLITDDLFLKWYREYGKVYVVYIMHRVVVQAYIPEVNREVLVLENYPKPKNAYASLVQLFGQRFMGRSLVTEVNHETWKPMSTMFSPTFHRNFLKTCIVQFNASCDQLLEELSNKADGKTEINMLDMFNRVSLDCISKVAFGMELDIFAEEKPEILRSIKLFTEGSAEAFFNRFLWCNPLPSAVSYRRRVGKAIRYIRTLARDCIVAKLEACERGEKLEHNIISHILKTSEGSCVTEKDLEKMVDHFITFMGAGQETTACLLASTVLEIGHHPEVAYKMKNEADAVMGDNAHITFEDLSKLKYTTAVLKETLRVHPPVASILRKLPKATVWNGFKIPSGTSVMVPIMNFGRLEEYFESPNDFMPSRFLGDESSSSNNVFIPFSIGPRKCIGQQFAMIEARVIMAKLMKHFTIELVPGQSFHYIKQITCKPKEGCLVYLRPAAAPAPTKPDGVTNAI